MQLQESYLLYGKRVTYYGKGHSVVSDKTLLTLISGNKSFRHALRMLASLVIPIIDILECN